MNVSMPVRAFVVFLLEIEVSRLVLYLRLNAREGICCFSTEDFNVTCDSGSSCLNAREGICCFSTVMLLEITLSSRMSQCP